MIACLMSAIFFRLDGWGKDDSFLPCWPFNKYTWLKFGGINYARFAIGVPVAIITHSWIYILTYALAALVPYGEDSILERLFGPTKWFIIGLVWGAASLSWGVALWLGMVSLVSKYLNIDHAWWEFGIMGFLGTFWVVFK